MVMRSMIIDVYGEKENDCYVDHYGDYDYNCNNDYENEDDDES